MEFRELIGKLTEAHDREVWSAGAKLKEENCRLERRVEDLEKQVESLGGDLLVESTSPNASSSRPAPLTLPGVASKWGTSDSGEDAGLIYVKPAGSGGSERHSQKQGSTSQDSGKELVSALKKPNRNSRSSRHSQTSLASASTPERPGRSSLRVSVPEINTLEVPLPDGPNPSPRPSFADNSGGSSQRPSTSSITPPGKIVSFGNLLGMGSSSKQNQRSVLPWPPPGGVAGTGRRNSAMLGGLLPPRSPGGPAGRRMSAAQVVTMARRGTTVGVGGLTLAAGQDIKLLEVWSKNPTAEIIARVTPRHMAANANKEGDWDSLKEEGILPPQARGCLGRFVSNPSSPRRIAYELFGLLLIVYDMIWLPMQVFEPPEADFFFVMGLVSSLYWTFDMPTSFLVGYAVQDKGIIEMRVRKIAWNYLRSWFVLDITIVAIDWTLNILEWTSGSRGSDGLSFFRIGKAVRFLRLLRLLRLLKAHGRLNELLEHVQSEFSVIVIGILKLIAFILLLNHLVACGWFWIGTWGISEAKLNWLEHTSVINDNLAYKYFTSLHWSLTQFTPASMEVTPRNEIERLFNVVVIMSAMVIFSTFISAITNAMNQLRNLNSERNEQASLLRRYMQQNNVSPPLKARVLQSIKALSQTRSRVHESDVTSLRLLPLSLRHDLSQEVYAPHLAVHPFFYVCNVCFSMQSRKIQSTCLAEKSLSTSQELITSGENATHMYFVIGGILDYLADERGDNEPAIALDSGAWLVEAALWVKWQHNGTANTNHGCELISVDAGGLQSILKDEKPVRQYANMFWKHFSDNPDTLSDVWCEEEVLFDWATRAMGQAETYYGDVIPAEPATNTNTKFGQFLQAQRRASSGFVGRRFSDDSLTGLVPNDFPAVLAGEGGRLASQQEGSEASSSSSGFSTDSDDSKNSKND